jgi:ABC-2 type transport system permease protein
VTAVLRKELADYFTSIRFIIFFVLTLFAAAAGLIAASQGIRQLNLPPDFVFLGLFTTSGTAIPSLVSLLALLIPLIGIALGFDAINSERTGGTLSRLLSQPVFRDSVINGKFLAGVVTLAVMIATVMGLVAGYGLRMIGVPPNPEEIIRLFIYFVLTVFYGAFWLGLAMLFSVVMRRIASSLLICIGVWLFFSIFILLIAPAIANAIAPISQNSPEAEIIRNANLQGMIMRISPNTLYSEAMGALLLPQVVGSLGVISTSQASFMIANPLSLTQSLLLIWPHLTSLISLSAVCFAISYVLFMRQEIRPT